MQSAKFPNADKTEFRIEDSHIFELATIDEAGLPRSASIRDRSQRYRIAFEKILDFLVCLVEIPRLGRSPTLPPSGDFGSSPAEETDGFKSLVF